MWPADSRSEDPTSLRMLLYRMPMQAAHGVHASASPPVSILGSADSQDAPDDPYDESARMFKCMAAAVLGWMEAWTPGTDVGPCLAGCAPRASPPCMHMRTARCSCSAIVHTAAGTHLLLVKSFWFASFALCCTACMQKCMSWTALA